MLGERVANTPAPPGVDLVYPRLITQDMEQCSDGVVLRRDGQTGLEVRSKDVHGQRAPTGMGVCIYNKQIEQERQHYLSYKDY